MSGFTDAEGCFTISLIERNPVYTQVQVRYILTQKNEEEVFGEIAAVVGGKVSYLKSYGGYNMTVNLLKLGVIVKYLSKYPLKTKKLITYKN